MSNVLKEKFLLFRIRAKKDPEAFGQIYDVYVYRIYRFIYFKVASAELAEDLTSETFLKAWQYLMGKRDVPHLQALLYTVARTTVIDHYRAAAASRQDVPLDETLSDEDPRLASDKFIRDIESGLDAARVVEKLHGLKDEYREVMVMRFLDGLSAGEIAAALGKTPAAVRVLIHRATRTLAAMLEHESQRTPENSLERQA